MPHMSLNAFEPTAGPSAEELSLISLAFAAEISECDVRALLRYLNGVSGHRFTGVYRFEPGWVASVSLYDRENPQVAVGPDVPMHESYCWLTGLGDHSYVIEDASTDARLTSHPARASVRAYLSVPLRDCAGQPWGTLCHFDFSPRKVSPGTIERMEYYRPLVQEVLVRDRLANWRPETATPA